MAEFIAELQNTTVTSQNGRRLAEAKDYIDKNYKEQISTAHLAELCLMSETNFRREFTRLFPIPPMKYRDEVRIGYAKELLESGFYNIGEVGALIGIEDAGYFCRFFKKHTSLTPGEYLQSKRI